MKTKVVAFIVPVEVGNDDNELEILKAVEMVYNDLVRGYAITAHVYNENSMKFPNMLRGYSLTPVHLQAYVRINKKIEAEII